MSILIAIAFAGLFPKQARFSVRLKRRFPARAISLPNTARSFGQDLAR